MSYPTKNDFHPDSGVGDTPSPAEVTLRLIASLPAPQGLEDRVQASLRAGLHSAPRSGRVLAWPARFPLSGEWMRAAAAAAIVCVVAGGGYGIYSRVQPAQPAQGVAGPRMAAPGGFSEGGAVRRPQTLQGPVVKQQAVPTSPKTKAPVKRIGTEKANPAEDSKTLNLPSVPAVQ